MTTEVGFVATLCQVVKDGRYLDLFQVVESYGPGAPAVGTRATLDDFDREYPDGRYSRNTAVTVDYSTGKPG